MKTKVVFRKFPDGQIIALFPDDHANAYGDIMSYMHEGQHAPASRSVIQATKAATPEEYSQLADELTALGYDLIPVKRLNRQ